MRKILNHELQRLTTDEFHSAPKIPLSIVLDDVRSMYNVGSVFRTADAFRVKEIILCGNTPRPPHREIHKTALGATESVSWKYTEDIKTAIAELKSQGVKIFAIEQVENSISLDEIDSYIHPGESYALIFGNEVKGVQQEAIELCDAFIEIPQLGTKHSLNISVSAGIAIWNFFKKMKTDL